MDFLQDYTVKIYKQARSLVYEHEKAMDVTAKVFKILKNNNTPESEIEKEIPRLVRSVVRGEELNQPASKAKTASRKKQPKEEDFDDGNPWSYAKPEPYYQQEFSCPDPPPSVAASNNKQTEIRADNSSKKSAVISNFPGTKQIKKVTSRPSTPHSTIFEDFLEHEKIAQKTAKAAEEWVPFENAKKVDKKEKTDTEETNFVALEEPDPVPFTTRIEVPKETCADFSKPQNKPDKKPAAPSPKPEEDTKLFSKSDFETMLKSWEEQEAKSDDSAEVLSDQAVESITRFFTVEEPKIAPQKPAPTIAKTDDTALRQEELNKALNNIEESAKDYEDISDEETTALESAQEPQLAQEAGAAETEKKQFRIGFFLLILLNVIFMLFLVWLLLGLLRNLDVLPSTLDLGYTWFNNAIYPIF